MILRVVLLLFLVVLSAPLHAQKRAWTSADGKSSFEGELLEYNATEVRLKRAADSATSFWKSVMSCRRWRGWVIVEPRLRLRQDIIHHHQACRKVELLLLRP